ncbi:hypothetical protein EVAR_94223_1 [Eumeta japonica]|uniref:Uncharacterized protein n=1 Tax=Eumeta variegata TaxID=151549 RepID=A0A4C1UNB1_EUMVA|nr:hypothetical protein EVAR_94223_1 [Eumeta japonica]
MSGPTRARFIYDIKIIGLKALEPVLCYSYRHCIRAVANLAAAQKGVAPFAELPHSHRIRRAVAFHPVSENSGSLLPFQEVGNALVIPLEL